MLVAIRGPLVAKTLQSAFVGVGGLTVQVFVPLRTLSELQVGTPVALHTTLLVRPEARSLYGFAQAEERDLFEQLLTVGGVGPRLGLALLSHLSVVALQEAIVTEDLERLTLVPGVGRKLAARMVLELRPRFERAGIGASVANASRLPGAATPPGGSVRAHVVEALTGLGYPPAAATAAARQLPDEASGSLEELIFQALRSLAKE
jgi:holliday junction DNA helicase RuvA